MPTDMCTSALSCSSITSPLKGQRRPERCQETPKRQCCIPCPRAAPHPSKSWRWDVGGGWCLSHCAPQKGAASKPPVGNDPWVSDTLLGYPLKHQSSTTKPFLHPQPEPNQSDFKQSLPGTLQTLRPVTKEINFEQLQRMNICPSWGGGKNHTSLLIAFPFQERPCFFSFPLWKRNGWQSVQPAGMQLDRHAVCR